MKNIYSYNKELLQKYILEPFKNSKEKYLYLHPFPTGTGKTTNVSLIIKDILASTDKKVIYIINNKKGRDEVYKSLENIDDVIILKSEVDYFNDNKDKIIKVLNKLNYKQKQNFISILELDLKIEAKKELLFSQISQLKNYYKNNQEEFLKYKEELKQLFPTIDMDKRVVILTTKKFLSPFTDFPYSYYIYEKENYKNSLIIIDEFDTQKNQFLSKIVEDSLDIHIDTLEFIREFYQKYYNRTKLLQQFDEVLKQSSLNYNHQTLLKEIEKFYKKYNLKDKIFIDKENNFEFFIPLREHFFVKKLFYKISLNEAKNYVLEKKAEYSFFKIYKKAINFFEKYINLIITYIDIVTKDNMDYKSSYETIFRLELDKYLENIFPLDNYEKGFFKKIKNIVYLKKYTRNTIKKGNIQDNKLLKFYDKPFEVIDLEVNNYSKIVTTEEYSLQTTPEMFLAYLANNFMVLGLSATALVESKLENFSLDIVNNLKIPTKEEFKNIKKLYKDKLKSKKFVFEVIHTNETIEDNLRIFLKNRDFKKYGLKIIELFSKLNNNSEYRFKKIINFVQTYLYFYENKLESFLHITSFNFKEEELNFIYKLLIFFIYIKNRNKIIPKFAKYKNIDEILSFLKYVEQDKTQNIVDILFNTGFERNILLEDILSIKQVFANKEFDIQKHLEKNRLFLISNYSFISKGQNIHYLKNNQLRDFDGIFLDEKTNILPTNPDSQDKAKMLEIFYKLYILHFYNQITHIELVNFIKQLKTPLHNSLEFFISSDEYVYIIEILFIQTIGRLLRSEYAQNHHILFDESYLKVIPNFDREEETLPVIDELIIFANRYLKLQNNKIIKEINEKSKKINNIKDIILNSFNNNELIYKETWQNIREFLLKNPTLSKKVDFYENFYFKSGYKKYFYKKKNDVEIVDFSITKKSGYSEFSLDSLKLKELNQIKELQLYKDISLDFSNQFVMIPYVFVNFYKGALGEKIGQKIFEIYDIKLKEIEGIKYETFDFEVQNAKAYIDFKFYNLTTLMKYANKATLLENIVEKIKDNRIEDSLIFIVNILKDKKIDEYLETKPIFTNKDIKELKNNKVIFISHLIKYENGYKIDYDKLNFIKDLL